MKRFLVHKFRDAAEPLEIYWLAGLERSASGEWIVRVVTLGMESLRVDMWKLPIGMLPLLSLGICFDDSGMLLETQSRGEIHTVTLPNLANGLEITSADMPPLLHSFFDYSPGVQRLLRYRTNAGEILIPTIELVRYLLLHNKTLANALMVPGQLITLCHFEPIGTYDELTLKFTSDMPVRSLSRDLALEFAWLAVHPEGRKTWDSVYRKSVDQAYVSLDPPAVSDAKMVFRGIERDGVWLVLEILHLSGREPPCKRLLYGHPSFRRMRGASVTREGTKDGVQRKSTSGDDVDVEVGDEGSRVAAGQTAVDVGAKSSEFAVRVPIKKIWTQLEPPQSRTQKKPAEEEGSCAEKSSETAIPKRKVKIKGSVGREVRGALVPPLEFRTLEVFPWDLAGELHALADTIRIMSGMLVDTEIFMSLCRLKPGRAFSSVGRRPRACLVVNILVMNELPIVLLDVDRGGEWALSTMSLTFLEHASFSDIEAHVKTVLDRLVDRGGHWDTLVDGALSNVCRFTRLPKVLPQRGCDAGTRYRVMWAWRLASKLGLPMKISATKRGDEGEGS